MSAMAKILRIVVQEVVQEGLKNTDWSQIIWVWILAHHLPLGEVIQPESQNLIWNWG